MCLSFWQAELPQRLIVNLLPVKLEIVNDDFEYIENPEQNFGRKHNIDFDNFERKESKNFLNFKYTKYNIYACDDFTCKGDKKYVGYMWKPWSERSFLGGCVNTAGRWQYAPRNPYRAHRQDERRHRQALGHQHSTDVPRN